MKNTPGIPEEQRGFWWAMDSLWMALDNRKTKIGGLCLVVSYLLSETHTLVLNSQGDLWILAIGLFKILGITIGGTGVYHKYEKEKQKNVSKK